MKIKPFHSKFTPFYLFLIAMFLFSLNSWEISIFSLDEAKNASCAREMLERGDLIVPTFNHELRTDKPPVHYWFMMLAYEIFGVSEFSARFFSAFFGAITVLITFLFGERFLSRKVGLISAFILLSSVHFTFQFHMAVPDPYLVFFLTSTFYSFYGFYQDRKEIFLYLFFLSMGFAFLTKGLIGLVLPSLIVISFLVIRRDVGFLRNMKLHVGIPIVLGVSLHWYIAVGLETDWLWIKEFIFKHNINRFSDPMEGHGGSFILTYLFVFVGMLPFSIFLLQVIKFVWTEKKDPLLLYLSLVVMIYTTFFAISKTKLPNYTVPVYPALSVLIGIYLDRLNLGRSKAVYSLLFYVILSIFLVWGLYTLLGEDRHLFLLKELSLYFLTLTVGGVFSLYFLFKKQMLKIIISLGLSGILMSVILYTIVLPMIDRESSVRTLLQQMDLSRPVGYYKRYNPAFSFYIRKKIEPLNSPEDVKRFIERKDVYILTREEYLQELEGLELKVLGKKKDLFENPTSVLLTNKE